MFVCHTCSPLYSWDAPNSSRLTSAPPMLFPAALNFSASIAHSEVETKALRRKHKRFATKLWVDWPLLRHCLLPPACDSGSRKMGSERRVMFKSSRIRKIMHTVSLVLFIPFYVVGFWSLLVGHFWRRSYENTKILCNLCVHFARQDGKNTHTHTQLKWPKYQKPRDENMGWTKHLTVDYR